MFNRAIQTSHSQPVTNILQKFAYLNGSCNSIGVVMHNYYTYFYSHYTIITAYDDTIVKHYVTDNSFNQSTENV